MEISRPGVRSELQLPAYTTATAMQDLSLIFDLHYSSWQRQVLNPLSEARNRTCVLMDASQIRFRCSMMGTTKVFFIYRYPIILAPFVENTIPSPVKHLDNLVDNYFTVTMRVYFWILNFTLFTSTSVHVPAPYCLG